MIIVRDAVQADADTLWSIRTRAIAQVCAPVYSAEVIGKWLAVPMPVCWGQMLVEKQAIVATLERQATGFGILDIKAQTIEAVFVSPEHAGNGIGRQLMAGLEALAARSGLTRLQLSSSLNAVNFYTRAGYQTDSKTRFSHPAGFALDCHLMSKQLVG